MWLAGLRVLLIAVVMAAQAVHAWDCLVANNVVINCPIPYKRAGTAGWFYNLTVTGTFAEPFTLGYYYQYLILGGPVYGIDQWTSGGACNVLAPPYSCPVASDFKMLFQWYYPHNNPAAFTETVAVTVTDQDGCPRISVGLKLKECQPVSSSSSAAIGMLPIPWSSSSANAVVVDPNQIPSSTVALMLAAESSSTGAGGEAPESSSGQSEGEENESSSPAPPAPAAVSSSSVAPQELPVVPSSSAAPVPSSSTKAVSSSVQPAPAVSSSAAKTSSSAKRLSSSARRASSSSAVRKARRDFAVTDSTGAAEMVDSANNAIATLPNVVFVFLWGVFVALAL